MCVIAKASIAVASPIVAESFKSAANRRMQATISCKLSSVKSKLPFESFPSAYQRQIRFAMSSGKHCLSPQKAGGTFPADDLKRELI